MLKLKVKPAAGLQVRHADGRIIDAKGETVPNASYYRRLIVAGDLIDLNAQAAADAAKAPAKKGAK